MSQVKVFVSTAVLGFPAGIYLLKVNNRNTRTKCEICSKLTVKIPERRREKEVAAMKILVHSQNYIPPHP